MKSPKVRRKSIRNANMQKGKDSFDTNEPSEVGKRKPTEGKKKIISADKQKLGKSRQEEDAPIAMKQSGTAQVTVEVIAGEPCSLEGCKRDDETDLFSPFDLLFKRMRAGEVRIIKSLMLVEDKIKIAFEIQGYSDSLSVHDCLTMLPGKRLNDSALDLCLFLSQISQRVSKPQSLFLPSSFNKRVIQYAGKGKRSDSLDAWCGKHVECYLPADTSMVEQVYIPVFDEQEKHWFLLVLNKNSGCVYMLDSVGMINARYEQSVELLKASAVLYGKHPQLGSIFVEGKIWKPVILKLPSQDNDVDCGMFVVKYCESEDIPGWCGVRYKTCQMNEVRLRYIVSLLMSPLNGAIHFREEICSSLYLKYVRPRPPT